MNTFFYNICEVYKSHIKGTSTYKKNPTNKTKQNQITHPKYLKFQSFFTNKQTNCQTLRKYSKGEEVFETGLSRSDIKQAGTLKK